MMKDAAWDPEEEVTDPNTERKSIEELELPNEDQDDEGEEEFLLPPEEDE